MASLVTAPAFTQKESFLHLMQTMSGLKAPRDWPRPAPKSWLAEHAKFDRWMHSPKMDWRTAPDWARHLRALVLASGHVKSLPSPSPPSTTEATSWPPHSPWLSPPWRGPGIYITWGFPNGFGTGQWNPDQFAQWIMEHGYEWASLEGFPATPGGIDNTPYHGPLKAALHARDMDYGVWERSDQMEASSVLAAIETYQPDFYEADIETFPIGDPTVPTLVASRYPSLPRRVLIAGMPDAQTCKPWIDNGWDCASQAYSLGGPGIAGSMDSDAKWRGWPLSANGHYTWPVLEVNADGSPGLRTQLPDVAQWGDDWAVYCGETMKDDDWSVTAGKAAA